MLQCCVCLSSVVCCRLSVCLWRYVLWLNGASQSKNYYWEPIGSRIWEIDLHQNEWPWPSFRGHIKVTSTIALHLTLNISETVRDRCLVPQDYQYEMAHGLSNGHVTDDVTWPWKVKLVTPIHLEHNISKTTRDRDFKFGMQFYMGNAKHAHK